MDFVNHFKRSEASSNHFKQFQTNKMDIVNYFKRSEASSNYFKLLSNKQKARLRVRFFVSFVKKKKKYLYNSKKSITFAADFDK